MRQTLYTRKLAIFERALKENSNNLQLRLESVKLKANNDYEIDTIDKIDSEFHQLLIDDFEKQLKQKTKSLDNLFLIWLEYIKFIQFKNLNKFDIHKNQKKYLLNVSTIF